MSEVIVLATKNPGKVFEISTLLKGLPYRIKTTDDYPGSPDVEETGDTLEENALLKARAICDFTGETALADDSGLEVDVLDGRPGVYSARYAGPDGIAQENIEKLLQEMAQVPFENRVAHFRCVIALVSPNGSEKVAEGSCEGVIAFETSGREGFGYDPVFIPNGGTRTFAEMSKEEKNRISHRGIALGKLQEVLTGEEE